MAPKCFFRARLLLLHGRKSHEMNGDEYVPTDLTYEPTIVLNVYRSSQRIRFVEDKLARAESGVEAESF